MRQEAALAVPEYHPRRSRPERRQCDDDTPGFDVHDGHAQLARPSGAGALLRANAGVGDRDDEPGWVTLRNPAGGVGLGFHIEDAYTPPVWPSQPGEQLMMGHLEIRVDDLEAACAHAQACGATLADFQPQEDVRVHLDPDGHPFCLYLET